MSEHTAGPWARTDCRPNGSGIDIENADGKWIATVMGSHGDRPDDGPGGFPTDDQCTANASLITAAPEMLSALELCANTLGALNGPTKRERERAEREARAAIAKATGAK